MLHRHSLSAVFAVCVLAAHPVWALDLREAYDAALARDAQFGSVRASATAAEEKLPQAKSQLLPQIGASFATSRNSLDATAPDVFGVETTNHDRYRSGNRSLNLRQPLYRSQSWIGYQQAKSQVRDARAQLEAETQNLVVRVSSAYFDHLLANDQLALIRAQKASTEAQLDAARKALKAGSGTRTDIDQAQAKLDQALAQELEIQQNVDYTRQQLENIVAEPVSQLASLDTGMLAAQSFSPGTLETWQADAEQRSFDLLALRERLESAQQELEKAQAAHKPTLDLVAQRSVSQSENITRINTTYGTVSIGLQLNVPLYSGGYVDSTVRQASALLDYAQQQLEQGRREVMLKVHKEYRGITEGYLKIRALEQASKSAAVALDSTRKSYTAGVRTLLDVLVAEQALMQANQDLAQARYVYLLSRIRLYALVGQASTVAVDQINSLMVGVKPLPPPAGTQADARIVPDEDPAEASSEAN